MEEGGLPRRGRAPVLVLASALPHHRRCPGQPRASKGHTKNGLLSSQSQHVSLKGTAPMAFLLLGHPVSEDTHSHLTMGKTRLAHFTELVSEILQGVPASAPSQTQQAQLAPRVTLVAPGLAQSL